MSGGTVLVTSRSFGSGEADPTGWLRTRGLDVVRADRGHQLAELRPLLAGAIGWIAGTAPVTRDHLEAAPRLRVLARYGSGVESVDLEAAARRGVVITNTPGANAEAVADHTIALMLAALRHLVEADRERRTRRPGAFVGRELGALTVGLVGFGHVGRELERRLRSGFGHRVLAVDTAVHHSELKAAGVGPADLPTVAAACDVVSLHLPGGPRPVIDAGFVAAMRRHAVLVNTARGGLLDEAAVASALLSGDLGAAAVDVLATAASPLLSAPHTIVTPHVAAHTVQAIDRMGTMAAEDVARVVAGEPPRHGVGVAGP